MLFTRAAWQLDIDGVPPLDVAVDVSASPLPDGDSMAELERLWLADWKLAWQRYDDHPERDPSIDAAEATEAAERLSEILALRFWGPSGMWQEGVNQAGR